MASPVGSNSDKTLRYSDATFFLLTSTYSSVTGLSCMQRYRCDPSHRHRRRYRLANAHTYHALPFLVSGHMSMYERPAMLLMLDCRICQNQDGVFS